MPPNLYPGPKGKATIYVAATNRPPNGNYSNLVVEIEKSEKAIDLLADDQL